MCEAEPGGGRSSAPPLFPHLPTYICSAELLSPRCVPRAHGSGQVTQGAWFFPMLCSDPRARALGSCGDFQLLGHPTATSPGSDGARVSSTFRFLGLLPLEMSCGWGLRQELLARLQQPHRREGRAATSPFFPFPPWGGGLKGGHSTIQSSPSSLPEEGAPGLCCRVIWGVPEMTPPVADDSMLVWCVTKDAQAWQGPVTLWL